MPFCPICSTKVEEDAKFCSECGAGLGEDEDAQTSETMRDLAEEYAARVREHPEDTAARYDLALALMYDGKWGRAAEHLLRVLEDEPEYADAHANLSVAQARLGQPEEALASIERAIELDASKKRYRKVRRQLTGHKH